MKAHTTSVPANPAAARALTLQLVWCALGALSMAGVAAAVHLEEPIGHVFGGHALLEMADGTVVEGDIAGTPTAQNGMGNVILHSEGKRRVQAEELRGLEVAKEVGHIMGTGRMFTPGLRSASLSRQGKALQQEAGADFRLEYLQKVQPAQDEKFVFRTITTSKGKTRLLQVLNVGFDSRMQVVKSPVLFGALDREREVYLVMKDGGEPVLVNKGNYREVYEELFGDCPATQSYEKKLRKMDNFSEHLFMYHRFCPPEEP